MKESPKKMQKLFIPRQNHENHEIITIPRQNQKNKKKKKKSIPE